MSALFSPLALRGITLRNRIGVSPMCQYSSTDGLADDWHLVHLGAFATGGAGLVMTEATAVVPEGRINVGDLGLWNDAQVPMLARITRFIRAQGAAPGIQLAHAGRKASVRRPWEGAGVLRPEEGGLADVDGPSAIPFSADTLVPRALTAERIAGVVTAFRDAAARAHTAGFEVLEVHAAHGYLLHEFLSPVSNQRTDGWGGPIAHRMRLTVDVVDAIRSVWPDRLPLLVRISASDWSDGGWTVEDSVILARVLADRGVDLVDCSSGGNVTGVRIAIGPGYQVPFARQLRRDAGVRTAAVGLITDPRQAESIIANDDADLVFLARELLRQPRWPLLAAHALGVPAPWPPQYERAKLR